MRTFTPKEISLCREIAEIYRKPINRGDYYAAKMFKPIRNIKAYLDMRGDGYAVIGKEKYLISIRTENDAITADRQKALFWFSLWQEHDCLEWLRKEHESIVIQYIWQSWNVYVKKSPEGNIQSYKFTGKTPLEALLSAVLAIMKEK